VTQREEEERERENTNNQMNELLRIDDCFDVLHIDLIKDIIECH